MAEKKKKTSPVKKTSRKKRAGKKASQKKSASLKKPTRAKTKKKTTTSKAVVKSKKKKSTTAKKSVKRTAQKKLTPKKKIKKVPAAEERVIKKYEEEDVDPDAMKRGDTPMTVVDHLAELRSRILLLVVFIIVLTGVGLYFSDYLLSIIELPFVKTGHKLNILKIQQGFTIKIKISVVSALLLTVPLIIIHIWRFVMPAINRRDRIFSRIALFFSVLLFYGGISFVFFLLLPIMIKFLLTYIPKNWVTTIDAQNYISLVMLSSLIMGLLFEMPIIVMILTRIGIVTPYFLSSRRKYAIVIIFIGAAVITPPDVVSQIFVGIPLVFLYEISILVSKLTMIRKRKKELYG